MPLLEIVAVPVTDPAHGAVCTSVNATEAPETVPATVPALPSAVDQVPVTAFPVCVSVYVSPVL